MDIEEPIYFAPIIFMPVLQWIVLLPAADYKIRNINMALVGYDDTHCAINMISDIRPTSGLQFISSRRKLMP